MRASAARFGLVGAVALAIGLIGPTAGAALPSSGADGARVTQASVSCGQPGQPTCPLQRWMRANVAGPLAENNTEALAAGLEKAAKLAPDPAWKSWATLALSGAAAAKRGDVAAARASCKGCHDAWRDEYRAKYRQRPVAP